MLLPKRKTLPFLENLVKEVTTLDTLGDAERNKFDNNARCTKNEREAVGIGDTYSRLQLTSMSNINTYVIGKKLNICQLYEPEEDGSGLQRYQGKVIIVSDQIRSKNIIFKKGEGVLFYWNANTECNEVEKI